MALTRAQLLSGNTTQGSVLSGQPQGVTQGSGLLISTTGQISFDSSSATGIVKTNNTAAYNAYVWPTLSASAGQQLTSDASGNLSWADPDGIAWTAKGELVVGTGAASQTILSVGADNTILIADSTQTSGLAYTSKFVATSSSSGSAILPSGTTAQRDTSPVAGYFRYNSTTAATEFWNGSAWGTTGTVTAVTGTLPIAVATGTSTPVISINAATSTTDGSMSAADKAKLDTASTIVSSVTGTTPIAVATGTSTPVISISAATTSAAGSMSATDKTKLDSAATIVSSVTGTLPITVATGTSTPVIAINAATQSLTGSVKVATTAEAITGTDVATALSPGTGVAKDAATMTGSAYIPAGTTTQRPTASTYTGQFRYNTTIPQLEYSDGTNWTAVGGSGGVTSFSAGTTGLTPSSATTGVVTLAGTLAVANGGTGVTTSAALIASIFPSQTGNSGKVLSTDGSTTSWIATGGTGTVTSIDVSGGTTGLTTSGGPVTASGTVTIAGTLAVANGGSGATTQAAAINNLLPAQTGNSGKYLTTDATNASWASLSAATPVVEGVVLGCTTALNTALGCNALVTSATTGCCNVALGVCALSQATGANVKSNVAIGYKALCVPTGSVTTSVAIGAFAGGAGDQSVTIGACAGCAITTGGTNLIIGANSGTAITTGQCNTIIGLANGLTGPTTAEGNTYIGALNSQFAGNGCHNTSVGFSMCAANGSGSRNTTIGTNYSSGGTSTPFFDLAGLSDQIIIGGPSSTDARIMIDWTIVSDKRDKNVLGSVPHGLDFVKQLEPKAFNFKKSRTDDTPHGPTRYGFLAQDILSLEGESPVLINSTNPEKLAFTSAYMIPVLVNAIKELSSELAAMQIKLDAANSNSATT